MNSSSNQTNSNSKLQTYDSSSSLELAVNLRQRGSKNYKEIKDKTGLGMKNVNKILKKQKDDIGKEYNELKQIIKSGSDRVFDYISNKVKDESKP